MEFGIDYRTKKREIDHTYYEFAAANEGDPVAYELDTTIGSLIEETRIDPYLMFSEHRGDATGTGPGSRARNLQHPRPRSAEQPRQICPVALLAWHSRPSPKKQT